MAIVYETHRNSYIGNHARTISMVAEGDDKNSVIEHYAIHVQTPGTSTKIILNRNAAMDLIHDLLKAMEAQSQYQLKLAKEARGERT